MKRIRAHILDLTVFLCGGVVMTYEIIGSRILAPYVGSSTYTWTSLIGVILAALSLGYWIGGKAADKNPAASVLAGVIFTAGGLVGVTTLVKNPVLEQIASAGFSPGTASIIAAVLLFAPASVLLGFVTPYAVRLSLTDIDTTGRTVGRLYALSTIGSIAGTFAAGFFLIPFVGSQRTLYILAGTLFAVSVLVTPLAINRSKIALIAVYVFGVAFNEFQTEYMSRVFNYQQFDTEYSAVRVFETKKEGRPLRALATDPYIYQSSMFLDNGEPGAKYLGYYHLISELKPDFEYSLVIGGAGYSFPKSYLQLYKTAKVDVVEIDPGMTAIAGEYFNLKPDPRLRSFHEDGRTYLNRSNGDRYDAVFVDAFNSLFNVPFHLTTAEAVSQIKRVLKRDGIVFVNLGTAVEGKGGEFLTAVYSTYSSVFHEVRLFRVDPSKHPEEIQNVILIASDLKIAGGKEAGNKRFETEFTIAGDSAEVLTDDLAPVEYQISNARAAAR